MSKALCLFLACFGLSGVFAQWSQDPQVPNPVAAFNGEQIIPKVAITYNGNTYVCRLDSSLGGYQVWLQLFSAQGETLWPAPAGILVSNHAQASWVGDYDMTVDASGNAIIAFPDIRNAGINNIYVYKISPEGTFLWGADGISLSADTTAGYDNMVPVLFSSNDHSTYVAWQRMGDSTSIKMNRLSPTGDKLWGENGVTISAFNGSYTWPQIIQSDADNILLKYYFDTGDYPITIRRINVAKYDTGGQRLWNAVITDAGGIAIWQQDIPFESDGAGGGILAWYDDRDSNMIQNVYAQRVNSAGTVTMPEDGALITVDAGNQQWYPRLAVDTSIQRIYAFYRVTDAGENNSGLGRQLLDYSGNRLWGNTAPMIINIGPNNCDTIGAYLTSNGAVCLYTYGADNLYATCWNSSGTMGWQEGNTMIASTTDTKFQFDFDIHPDQWVVLVWEQGLSDYDIYAMRLNSSGSLGMEYPPPHDLTATLVPPNAVLLNWQAPSQYLIPLNYHVFMDGDPAQVTSGNITSCQLSGLSYGVHFFFVMASYDGDHLSMPTDIVNIAVVANDDPATPPFVPVLSVYPNPCKGSATLSFNLAKPSQKCLISIYNIRGQKLATRDIVAGMGINSCIMDVADLDQVKSGTYLIRLELDNEVRLTKAIILE